MGWTIKDDAESKRFQYDYQKTVSDLLIFSHYKTGSEICAEYGLQLTAEAGGPGSPFWDTNPVDALKALGNVGIPRGEFWLGNPRNLFLVKEIFMESPMSMLNPGLRGVVGEMVHSHLKNWWTEHFVKVLTVLPIMDLPIHH